MGRAIYLDQNSSGSKGTLGRLARRLGRFCGFAAGASLWMAQVGSGNSVPDSVAPPPLHGEVPKSIFNDDPAFGKDPFFPKSARRKTAEVITGSGPEVAEEISLKGISSLRDRRMVLINTYTFEEGEQGEIKVGGQTATIHVREVKDRSVIVSINGVLRELRLRPGI